MSAWYDADGDVVEQVLSHAKGGARTASNESEHSHQSRYFSCILYLCSKFPSQSVQIIMQRRSPAGRIPTCFQSRVFVPVHRCGISENEIGEWLLRKLGTVRAHSVGSSLENWWIFCCCLRFLLPCPKTFSALFALLIVLLVEGNVWTR